MHRPIQKPTRLAFWEDIRSLFLTSLSLIIHEFALAYVYFVYLSAEPQIVEFPLWKLGEGILLAFEI